jgi:hypothetical protein
MNTVTPYPVVTLYPVTLYPRLKERQSLMTVANGGRPRQSPSARAGQRRILRRPSLTGTARVRPVRNGGSHEGHEDHKDHEEVEDGLKLISSDSHPDRRWSRKNGSGTGTCPQRAATCKVRVLVTVTMPFSTKRGPLQLPSPLALTGPPQVEACQNAARKYDEPSSYSPFRLSFHRV